MSDVQPIDRLRDERNVWLATVRPDGRPHVAPVWFVYVDDRIWIGTGLDSVRVRNLRANPAASASLEDGDTPIVAEGMVLVHEHDRPPAVVDAFRAKFDWDITREADEDLGTLVLLELRPHRWLYRVVLPTVGAARAP
jgi:PPOX class probable F420-dependent enzyme